MSHSISKPQLRQEARERRAALATAQPAFAQALARHAGALDIVPGTLVGGYRALAGEADPSILIARLAALGSPIAFPRVVAKDAALDFHQVPLPLAENLNMLAPGAFGVSEPPAAWPKVIPTIVLVPLLAFDAQGHRLGYGGGFYDRTLALIRPRAIGVAFAGQIVDFLPHVAHDYPLDAVVTDLGMRQFR